MKKLLLLSMFFGFCVENVQAQITITGTYIYDDNYVVGNYSMTVQGSTITVTPSSFDAGTTYYHGKDLVTYSYYGEPILNTYFIVRQSNVWVLEYGIKSRYSSSNTKLFQAQNTSTNPPCNSWWIRSSDNDKVSIQINGTSCDNTCSPASALTVSKIGSECVTSTVSLSASACSGTYRWETGATTSAISPNTNKTYYVACDNGSSCPSLLASGTINYPAILVNPSIVSNAAAIVEPNTSVTLSTSCASPSTVKWDDNSTANTRIVAPATSTVYAAKCVNGTCESNVSTSIVTVNTTSTSCIEHWERIDYSTPIKSGTNLFFVKNDPQYGYELWKADLNMNNSSMVKNINAKKKGFGVNNAVTMNGIRYFIATDYFSETDGYSSNDLWRTDGTTNGTYKVKDINPDATLGIYPSLMTVGNLLYFNANDGVSGGLWRSDGTAEGTYKILNNVIISDISYNYFFNNVLYFGGYSAGVGGSLYKTDGTVAGTVLLKNAISDCRLFTELNGIIYFQGNDNISGTELWKTDGTSVGTSLVKDIYPGVNDGMGGEILVFNGKLIFTGYNPNSSGYEPWISDGTTAGTMIIKDIRPGTIGSGAGGFKILNGVVYFSADDGNGATGAELYRTDGTAAGTYIFKDLVAGTVGSNPQMNVGVIVGSKLYFCTYDGSTAMWSLWETDGTNAGTILKFNIGSGTAGKTAGVFTLDNILYCNYNGYYSKVNSTISGLISIGYGRMTNNTVFNGYIYYNTTSFPLQIRRVSLATNADEAFLGSVAPASFPSFSGQFVFNGELHFFGGSDNGNNQTISFWKSDGTIAGSASYFTNQNVKDGNAFEVNNTFWSKDVNGTFYFTANENGASSQGSPSSIWKTDGTEAGTTKLIDNATLQISESIGNDLYFISNNTLYKTNGATTIALKNNSSVFNYYQSESIINHNSELYFTSSDATNGSEIWKTNGSVAGTILLKDINIGSGGIAISGSKSIGNKLFFYVSSGGTIGLWVTDGTSSGTILLKQGTIGSNIFEPVVLNNILYFYLQSTDGGTGLWSSDGTVNGTNLVCNNSVANLYIFNNQIFFSSSDATFGSELWVSDGTRFGTRLFKDINKGVGSSSAAPFAIRGGYLYLYMNGMLNNLYKSDGTPEGTVPVLYQTDFKGYEIEGKIYQDVPTFSNVLNYKLTTNPKLPPNIISAYDVVIPNTSVSLYNTNSTSELVWAYRNTTLVNGNGNNSERSLIDIPPVTTTYSLVQRDKVCQSPPTYKTITIYSCQGSFNLSSTNSPSDDISTGTITKQASSTTGSITATNKITGTANVTYQAKTITLDQGFKAENGTVFKAEVGGCN